METITIIHFRLPIKRQDGSRIITLHSLLMEATKGRAVTGVVHHADNFLVPLLCTDNPSLFPGEVSRYEFQVPEKGDVFQAITTVSLANNGTGRSPKRYTPGQALDTVCAKMGVDISPTNGHAHLTLLPLQRRQGITIDGIYKVQGNFLVKDVRILRDAMRLGIGSRRSYGMGMVVPWRIWQLVKPLGQVNSIGKSRNENYTS